MPIRPNHTIICLSLENFLWSFFARALVMREQEGDAPAAVEMPSGACSALALIAVHNFSVNLLESQTTIALPIIFLLPLLRHRPIKDRLHHKC